MRIGTCGNYINVNIQLNFKNIIDNPKCRIYLNQDLLYEGMVQELFNLTNESTKEQNQLRIQFFNKNPSDTIIENGVIIRDKSFELERITIDEYDIQELIWQSRYDADCGDVYRSCLFFGPNGSYLLDFHTPILHWILESRSKASGEDPSWEQDYNYYQQACRLLTQI